MSGTLSKWTIWLKHKYYFESVSVKREKSLFYNNICLRRRTEGLPDHDDGWLVGLTNPNPGWIHRVEYTGFGIDRTRTNAWSYPDLTSGNYDVARHHMSEPGTSTRHVTAYIENTRTWQDLLRRRTEGLSDHDDSGLGGWTGRADFEIGISHRMT